LDAITPIGDVLPCPYVHIGIGNIFESSLKEISENGFRVKYFREYSEKCLAGEDKEFIKNYMAKDGTTIFNPLKIDELFDKEDLIEEKVTLPAMPNK
jgi:MoaA/NifB/PqqE/SkfB family radical SAM enzyme